MGRKGMCRRRNLTVRTGEKQTRRRHKRNAAAQNTDKMYFVGMARAMAVVCLLIRFLAAAPLYAQSSDGASQVEKKQTLFAPRNTWGIFGEFSPDSSHIFLGIAQQRRLLMFGGEYAHRLHSGDRVA